MSMDENGVTYNHRGNSNGDFTPITIDENVMKRHNKMPKSILESFQKDPGKSPQSNLSVLSSLPQEMFTEENVHQKPMRTESRQSIVQSSSPIDYSLIKTIINESVQESVKKYVSAMSKKLINEGIGNGSSNDLIAMKAGKTFSFIDKQGNVYECILKKKGNVNDISE
jgi:hypothetical protein